MEIKDFTDRYKKAERYLKMSNQEVYDIISSEVYNEMNERYPRPKRFSLISFLRKLIF